MQADRSSGVANRVKFLHVRSKAAASSQENVKISHDLHAVDFRLGLEFDIPKIISLIARDFHAHRIGHFRFPPLQCDRVHGTAANLKHLDTR